MNRRTVLTGTGIALTAVLSGCLDETTDPQTSDESGNGDGNGNPDHTPANNSSTDGNGDTDAVPVLTDYTVSEAVITPDKERTSEMEAWGAFVASESVADEYFEHSDAPGADKVRSFVDETAFDAGERLVYVQAYAPQTCYELALDGEPTISDDGLTTINTAVNRTAGENEACGDAVTPVELLVRLSFDLEASIPDVVVVEIDGGTGDPDALRLKAEPNTQLAETHD